VTARASNRLLYTGAVAWVLLTVSLASWWMYFELDQATHLSAISGTEGIGLHRVQRMLGWEGGTFIALLVAGGIALVISLRREQTRQQEVEAFFMAFTHDLKTALASLQLQAESLQEDLPDAANNPNMQRLMKDALRLQLQLENSLFFAQPEGGLLIEPIAVRELVEETAVDWPELVVTVEGNARARADRRALHSVIRNLLQNAVLHGAATRLMVEVRSPQNGRVFVTAADNGRGVDANLARQIGRPFSRPTAGSGTGVGLYVSRQLVSRMQGTLTFSASTGAGFTAVLDLPVAD
jgi:hypothetical protein